MRLRFVAAIALSFGAGWILGPPAIDYARAQSCNSPSGFVQLFGTIPIGDVLVLGPDCNHAQDGGVNLPSTIPSRVIWNYNPIVYDLAIGALAVQELHTTTNITVPANDNYADIRFSQANGSNNTFTVGAGAIATSLYIQAEELAGSDATANLYGAILHCVNDGPGTCKGIHAGAFSGAGSTGVAVAVNAQVTPVATSGYTAAVNAIITGGINDIAVAYGVDSNPLGERWQIGVGSTIAPTGINTAYYRAWMATASSANARAFQTLNNAGTEIQYIKKTGEIVSSTGLFGGTEANGLSITQTSITRTAAAGSMVISAGTNAGNSMSLQTGGTTRLTLTDTGAVSSGVFQTGSVTVAGLVACAAGTQGARFFVTDQNTALAYHGAVTGGGAQKQAVVCDGTSWYQD